MIRLFTPAYDEVEGLRQQLLKSKTVLNIDDFGAGSAVSKTNQRTMARLQRTAAKPKKFGQLLYRMVKFYQPKTILELGTSLGISTSYMAKAKPACHSDHTGRGKRSFAIAKQNFTYLQLRNIKTIEGNFDNTLPPAVREFYATIDFAFHRR